ADRRAGRHRGMALAVVGAWHLPGLRAARGARLPPPDLSSAGPGGATPLEPPGRRWRLADKPAGPIARAGPGERPPGTPRWPEAPATSSREPWPCSPGQARRRSRARGRLEPAFRERERFLPGHAAAAP